MFFWMKICFFMERKKVFYWLIKRLRYFDLWVGANSRSGFFKHSIDIQAEVIIRRNNSGILNSQPQLMKGRNRRCKQIGLVMGIGKYFGPLDAHSHFWLPESVSKACQADGSGFLPSASWFHHSGVEESTHHWTVPIASESRLLQSPSP